MFSDVYVRRVLDPSYSNWRSLLQTEFFAVQKAHLVMLSEYGIVSRPVATQIKTGIEAIRSDFSFPEHIPPDTEDLYFLFERELGSRIGMENAGRLHTARSRNDMDATIFRLRLKTRLLDILRQIETLVSACVNRVRANGTELVILYTHGQPANVSTFGHYISSFALEILEGAAQVARSLEIVDQSPMGACAITTTGFPVNRNRVAALLGLSDPVTNSYQAISGSHWLSYPASAVHSILTDIGRFVMDVLHKSSCEVGLFGFPDELVQISSIMPQKRNPVILEHIRIQSGLASGILNGIGQLFHNTPYQDINEVADAPVAELFRALDYCLSTFELMEETVSKIQCIPARAQEISTRFGITTTELADSLVREQGLDFRMSHALTSQFIKNGADKAALRVHYKELSGRTLEWTDTEIDTILSPKRFVEVRKITGGPAPEGMVSVMERMESELGQLNRLILDRKNAQILTDRRLSDAWAGI